MFQPKNTIIISPPDTTNYHFVVWIQVLDSNKRPVWGKFAKFPTLIPVENETYVDYDLQIINEFATPSDEKGIIKIPCKILCLSIETFAYFRFTVDKMTINSSKVYLEYAGDLNANNPTSVYYNWS